VCRCAGCRFFGSHRGEREGERKRGTGERKCASWVGCLCVVGVGVCVFVAPLVLTNLSARVRARRNRHGR
jgi:hypothetical protein